MNGSYVYQKAAFLDTNALHFVSLYVRYAREEGLYPFIDVGENENDTICEARSHIQSLGGVKQSSTKRLRDSLGDGLSAVAWMKKNDVRLEYSPITKLELMTGRLRGRALEVAAGERIPDRMWSYFWADEEQIADRLDPTDLRETEERVEEISAILAKIGIVASVDTERARDVLDLAQQIAGIVYIQAIDCIIFASTLVARADYLITSDGYFRRTVNRIRSEPEEGRYKRLYERVRELTSDDKVVLPEAWQPKRLLGS